MLENLNRDDFAKCLNETFQIEFTLEDFTEVKLIEVSDLTIDSHQEMYSLVFLAPVYVPTEPNTFKVSNKKLGEFELSLSPFWKGEEGIKFEATFSHLLT